MRIATWNINSVRTRTQRALNLISKHDIDVLCLQETKVKDDKFPREAFEDAGLHVTCHGLNQWNGVAILARDSEPLEIRRGLPGDPDDSHSRYLEAAVHGVIVASLYLPNGNPQPGPKFDYKLAWFERLIAHARALHDAPAPVVLAGDYNVIPAARDVYNPAAWADDALFRPATREAFQSLLGLGLTDALRAVNDEPGQYTFWDYQAGAWQKNWGLRIDHLLMSPQASDRLIDVGIDSYVRAWEKPSDHVPVWADLDFETA